MLCNWHFDMFWPDHWRQAIALWKAGWVVRAPKEWAFVLLIITYIPMLLTGWWTLSLVAWEEIIWKIITFPYTIYCKLMKSPTSGTVVNSHYGVVKRKSYKQIRPAGINTLRVPISDYGENSGTSGNITSTPPAYSGYSASSLSSASSRVNDKVKKTDVAATIDHALFKFDDDDDDDFDLDIDSFEKTDLKKKPKEESKKTLPKFDFDDDDDDFDSKENNYAKTSGRKEFDFDDDDDDFEDEKPRENNRRNNKRKEEKDKRSSRQDKNESSREDKNKRQNRRSDKESGELSSRSSQGPVYDALSQKNYGIISNISIEGTAIDFIGISDSKICLCMVDKENGDWLADEEMFNGEEPLWFSENSHRVSPVCLLNKARNAVKDKLDDEGFEQAVEAFVVIQMANIINADDMFETWNDMNINVTRINRGAPKEIRLFSKVLSEADGKPSSSEIEKLNKVLKSLK
ncbi:MAG: hypothetical protein IJ677_06370 [Alphaproteobacteria bacterium]|nr:hypothetical protein [Alphaproteobacteria bacterium]